MALSKSVPAPIIALQTLLAGGLVKAEVDVSAALEAALLVRVGRKAMTALSANVRVIVEGSHAATGDAAWVGIGTALLADTAAAEAEAVSGSVSAGVTNIPVVSTTNLAEGEWVFILNTTFGNSEWAFIRRVTTDASIDVVDGLQYAQTGATIYDRAGVWQVSVPEALAYKRLRVVVSNASGQDVAVEVRANLTTES